MNGINATHERTLTTMVPVKLVVAVKLQPCLLVSVAQEIEITQETCLALYAM